MIDTAREKYCCSFTTLICQLIVQFKNIVICLMLNKIYCVKLYHILDREHSGIVVECLTRDQRAAGSSLTGVIALRSLGNTHLS